MKYEVEFYVPKADGSITITVEAENEDDAQERATDRLNESLTCRDVVPAPAPAEEGK